MSTRSCEEIARLLVDYVDGELDGPTAKEVAEHLEKCGPCRRTLGAISKSLDVAQAIWEDGLVETGGVRTAARMKDTSHHWGRYAAVAAGILLVAGIGRWWVASGPAVKPQSSSESVERAIAEAGHAAQLLAAAELLEKQPEGATIARRQYGYIVERYPATRAATEAKLRIQ